MAANLCEEEKLHFPGIVDGSSNLPISSSCFQLLKPSFDEANQHCSPDVLPVLVEEASFPGQDVYSISVLPEEGNTQCTSQLTFLSFLEVPFLSKNQMWLDAQLDCQKCIDLGMESAYANPPCIVDINIENENLETLKSNDETVGSMKSEGVKAHLQKVLQRQSSINLGGKFMQLLMNYGLMSLKLHSRDKSVTERVYDAPNNRWRRYKRAASFDSRKVVLFFSILSSFGTLVLIYLTLRVRQTGDGFVHI